MPFYQDAAATEPLTAIYLVQRTKRCFQLAQPIYYRAEEASAIVRIDAHDLSAGLTNNSTDLASVPTWMWGLIASYGRQTAPALLHDQRMAECSTLPAGEALRLRRVYDEEFRRALLDTGVAALRARLMWAGISIQAYLEHSRVRGLLLAASVAVGALAFIAAIWFTAAGAGPLPVTAAVLLTGLLCLAWARDWPVLAVMVPAFALFSPVLAAAAAGSLLLWLCETGWWAVTKPFVRHPGPPPVVGPLARTPQP
ncbi:DUF1353 domain-containing protein [Arthrobacter sp. CAU 1506]|uniref:DUF1353 domain-containing protein n=1 Tax=Arthrobacter sp. CAU 1506 TaxID=2560052 RepID=UPI0010ACD4FF|nr:DUF1353 domain-containing protein [Arthrobacter sp. CAU 1506]TJY72510.1 DUF1353 domain-containing protein [Arthrobacter sp. CAU 1506]